MLVPIISPQGIILIYCDTNNCRPSIAISPGRAGTPGKVACFKRLYNMGSLLLKPTASSIHKEERQYIRIVSFEYLGEAQFGKKHLDTVLVKMKIKMPEGFTAVIKEGNGWGDQGSQRYLFVFVLLILIFFIASIVFESLRNPLLIVSIIPISFIGLFLIFYLGGFYFDQGGYAAFILLGGLVANSAIFLINDYLALRKTSTETSHNTSLLRAAGIRAKTILLIIISTCCSMIPFLLEGDAEVFWFSLAIGTVGGLLFSLFAILIFLPVLLWNKE